MVARVVIIASLIGLLSCGSNAAGVAPSDAAGVDDTAPGDTTPAGDGDAPDGGRRHPVLDQSCAPSESTVACDKCSEERCCETRAACDADCVAVFSCIESCTAGAAACVEKCLTENPAGAAAYSAQNACVNLYCTTPCSGKADACRDCRLENCALEHVTCFADPECRRYGYCYEACTDAACDDTCRAKTTAAVIKTYDAYDTCLNKRCRASCW
ncbi:MAG: hypothetical protein HYV09_40855 [Deltaproteobacteria bacterium]|nr:hypothetical protein [Deltaproteobacteria bacterium]